MGNQFKSNKQKLKCKFSSRHSQARPSHLMSSQLTPLKTLKPRFRIRKVSHLINKDLSSLVSSSKTVELSPITTSRKNLLSTWSSDLEVVCKSSSRPSLVRPSPSMLNQLTPLKTSRPRSKTRKVSHQISKDSSSLESNLRMEELSPTTTSKRNLPFTWSSDLEVVCKSSSRPSLVKPSLSMLSQLIPLKTSRPRSKTRKVSHQISKDLSSLESNLKTEEP